MLRKMNQPIAFASGCCVHFTPHHARGIQTDPFHPAPPGWCPSGQFQGGTGHKVGGTMKTAKLEKGEATWHYVKRVFGHCSSTARLLICDRMELEQLGKLKNRPYGAMQYLEAAIKENANLLIQEGMRAGRAGVPS